MPVYNEFRLREFYLSNHDYKRNPLAYFYCYPFLFNAKPAIGKNLKPD
jgi:hypothetical protein